jgi:hypothetical protein
VPGCRPALGYHLTYDLHCALQDLFCDELCAAIRGGLRGVLDRRLHVREALALLVKNDGTYR